MDAQNFVAAQAVKDATMAWFILKNRGPKELFFIITVIIIQRTTVGSAGTSNNMIRRSRC